MLTNTKTNTGNLLKKITFFAILALLLFGLNTAHSDAATKPAKVKGLSGYANYNSVSLSWNKTRGAKRYKVYIKRGGTYRVYKTVKKTYTKIGGLNANTTYRFKVAAFKGKKHGKKSKPFVIRTSVNRANNNNRNKNNTEEMKKQEEEKKKREAEEKKKKEEEEKENKEGTYVTTLAVNNNDGNAYITPNTTKDANGLATMKLNFTTDGGLNWLKNRFDFAVEDVTPKGYKDMLTKLGCSSGVSITSIEYSKYVINPSYPESRMTLTIQAKPGTRAIKLYDKNNKQINGTATKAYLYPDDMDSNRKYFQYDLDLYKKLRQKIESKLTIERVKKVNNKEVKETVKFSQMTTLEKFDALANYINGAAHYSNEGIRKENNPGFWDKWSVDNTTYSMGDQTIIHRMERYCGGATKCYACEELYTIATEDLGLKEIPVGSTNQEGVYVGYGKNSSMPNESSHETFYYVVKEGSEYKKYDWDVTGFETAGTCCARHICEKYLISLD